MTVAARSLAGLPAAETARARRVPELDGIPAIAIWLGLAALSWRYFESPILRLKQVYAS